MSARHALYNADMPCLACRMLASAMRAAAGQQAAQQAAQQEQQNKQGEQQQEQQQQEQQQQTLSGAERIRQRLAVQQVSSWAAAVALCNVSDAEL